MCQLKIQIKTTRCGRNRRSYCPCSIIFPKWRHDRTTNPSAQPLSFDREVRGGLLFSFFLHTRNCCVDWNWFQATATRRHSLGRGVRFFMFPHAFGKICKDRWVHHASNATGKGCLEIGKGSGIVRLAELYNFNFLQSFGKSYSYRWKCRNRWICLSRWWRWTWHRRWLHRRTIFSRHPENHFRHDPEVDSPARSGRHANEPASGKIADWLEAIVLGRSHNWWQLCNCRRSSGEQIYASELCHWWSSGTSFKIKNWWNGKAIIRKCYILVKEFPPWKDHTCYSICSESDQRFRRRMGWNFICQINDSIMWSLLPAKQPTGDWKIFTGKYYSRSEEYSLLYYDLPARTRFWKKDPIVDDLLLYVATVSSSFCEKQNVDFDIAQ